MKNQKRANSRSKRKALLAGSSPALSTLLEKMGVKKFEITKGPTDKYFGWFGSLATALEEKNLEISKAWVNLEEKKSKLKAVEFFMRFKKTNTGNSFRESPDGESK